LREGMLVENISGIPAGSYITSIGATSFEISKPAVATSASTMLNFTAKPTYTGLTLSLLGYWPTP
jgi:hypothetical protein